ncbi:hypothetical protein Shyhy02_42190 [Streptomyces hygroscopicus subsp. hygroscopicus]|nr:hypothetical protein Shyhy02_42190 [Streptomyces hygroscopicus subsp. hygroscopicus]
MWLEAVLDRNRVRGTVPIASDRQPAPSHWRVAKAAESADYGRQAVPRRLLANSEQAETKSSKRLLCAS